MTATTLDMLLLALGVFGVMVGLTALGEALRARLGTHENHPVIETYMTRVRSWWAMVILLSLALLSGRTGVLILFGFVSFAALREFLTLTAKSQADHIALATAFFMILPAQYILIGMDWPGLFSILIPVYAFLLLPIVSVLRGDANRFLIRVAETQWGLMICVYCASHLPALMTLDIVGYGDRAVLLIALLVLVVQLGDLLEYYFGRRLGGRRVAPGISPKTWAGMAAGIASAALIGGLLHWVTPFGPLGAMAMAAVATTTGLFGNIVFAAIRRDKGVKDWSHLIPGQGGIMDQLDSVAFAAPVFYHLTRLIWG